MMIDEQSARVRAHHNNIRRYRGLLQTRLTELFTSLFLKYFVTHLARPGGAADFRARRQFPHRCGARSANAFHRSRVNMPFWPEIASIRSQHCRYASGGRFNRSKSAIFCSAG
jgi:hypothetical protein